MLRRLRYHPFFDRRMRDEVETERKVQESVLRDMRQNGDSGAHCHQSPSASKLPLGTGAGGAPQRQAASTRR